MSNGSGQNIIDKILADASLEAKAIADAAQNEANAVLQAAEQKAEKEKAYLYGISKSEAEKAKAKEISSADMKAKKMVLSQKQSCIEEVISDAKKKLSELTDIEYKVIVTAMIKNACIEDDSEIILSKKDKENFGKEVKGLGIKLSDEIRDIEGGFVIKNGDIEYNYSFESIISVEKEEIEQIAANILFG